MAKLYVTEYASAALPFPYGGSSSNPLQNYPLDAAQEPAITTQVLSIGVGSVQSNPFNVNTRFVRLHSDAICSVEFGADPTASAASSQRMAANQTEYKGVKPGDLVAVITNT